VNEAFARFSAIDWVSDAPLKFVELGDYAFVLATSRNRYSLADGTQRESSACVTTLLHRAVDGNWRIVVDHTSSV
jgi:ketosteroid isomerase-like protein